MNLRIITASAGSGKTTRLSQLLDEAIGAGRVAPDRIVATTFTKQAAAELVERARSRLLQSGRGEAAHRLLAARIGTVNSVCGSFVTDFSFELGLAPSLRVLDEVAAEVELNRALAAVVPAAVSQRLQWFPTRFDMQLDWRQDVRKLVEAARANGLTSDALRACAARSTGSLDACLGPCEPDGGAIEAALLAAVTEALAAIDLAHDTTKGTATYVAWLRFCKRDLERGRLRWGDWAHLSGGKQPCKKSQPHTVSVERAAARHLGHPGLRAEMHELIERLFELGAAGIDAYQQHKRDRGVIDYVDQETLTLALLQRDDVRDALRGQLDLVLVDEFQDTSPLQLAIFLQLAALAKESVWVGDPKQAIFGFRGTDPKLMDAAIESLTSPSVDPELVERAIDRVGGVETLSVSYRSRPELVRITSDIFARAFGHQGMPEERIRLEPASDDEAPGLGPTVEVWPLVPVDRKNMNTLAACAASGVKALLTRAPLVRDGAAGARTATAGDLAVLCRTNAQCQLVADALDQLGIAAVVPRMRLLDTAEAMLVHAGLRLWIDPYDAVAAAEIARLIAYPTRGDAFMTRALDVPGRDAFADDPTVVAVAAAREADRDAGLLDIVEAVMTAVDARHWCAAWGTTDQRRANLEAFRGHAEAYAAEATANRHAPTLAGFLMYLAELVDDFGWYNSRTDAQALRGDERAVTVSTWHRAKGLEWPITVLYGLETLRAPDCYGVRVVSDRADFSVENALADRWVRYWPNPYTTSGQKGAVKTAYEASPAFADIVDRSDREALRVLYVGWTRARDRLILAVQEGKLGNGLVGKLQAIDAGLISEPAADPAGERTVTWAGRKIRVHVAPASEAQPVASLIVSGDLIQGLPSPPSYPPARQSPSSAEPVSHMVAQLVDLGPPIALRDRSVALDHLGDAIHGFFAVDRPETEPARRLALAARLLAGYCVTTALEPAELLEMSDRLSRWIGASYADHSLRRELPVATRTVGGTVLAGTADLVLLGQRSFVLADHKSFPGDPATVDIRAAAYSGQLASYAAAVTRATGLPLASAWLHFPLSGRMVELTLPLESSTAR